MCSTIDNLEMKATFDRIQKEHREMLDYLAAVNEQHAEMMGTFTMVNDHHQEMLRKIDETQAMLRELLDRK